MRPKTAICHALLIGIAFWLTAPARAAQPTDPPLLSLSKDAAEKMPARAGSRTTLLVPLPAETACQDMAFLAAIPATTVVNHGAHSLVALDAAGTLSPEIQDYLRRYRPDAVFLLGDAAADLAIPDYLSHPSNTAGGCEYGPGKWAGFRRVGYAGRKQ